MADYQITGRVSSRSSRAGAGGPPGEAEIARLNPQRIEQLKHLTGWDHIEPGTLNLTCEESEISSVLSEAAAIWQEPGESIRYPDRYRHIPLLRKSYFYFHARVAFDGKFANVLVRRAEKYIPGRLEIYAAVNLRALFGLADGDDVSIEFES